MHIFSNGRSRIADRNGVDNLITRFQHHAINDRQHILGTTRKDEAAGIDAQLVTQQGPQLGFVAVGIAVH